MNDYLHISTDIIEHHSLHVTWTQTRFFTRQSDIQKQCYIQELTRETEQKRTKTERTFTTLPKYVEARVFNISQRMSSHNRKNDQLIQVRDTILVHNDSYCETFPI